MVTADTTMRVPGELRDRLTDRKKYESEPLWRVVYRLEENCEADNGEEQVV